MPANSRWDLIRGLKCSILGVSLPCSGLECISEFVMTGELGEIWEVWEIGGLQEGFKSPHFAGWYQHLTLCRTVS
jgi:hypothetical protein